MKGIKMNNHINNVFKLITQPRQFKIPLKMEYACLCFLIILFMFTIVYNTGYKYLLLDNSWCNDKPLYSLFRGICCTFGSIILNEEGIKKPTIPSRYLPFLKLVDIISTTILIAVIVVQPFFEAISLGSYQEGIIYAVTISIILMFINYIKKWVTLGNMKKHTTNIACAVGINNTM